MIFGRKNKPLLGLDITTSSVKLIELSGSSGHYKVDAYAAEPTPNNAVSEKAIVDAQAVGEAIRRATSRLERHAHDAPPERKGAVLRGIRAVLDCHQWAASPFMTPAGSRSSMAIVCIVKLAYVARIASRSG